MQDLISIITPAYNNGSTLREAGDSVMAQSYTNWEWIIINNGSTDNTDSALTPFLNDPRVKLVKLSENKGASGGRNAGLAVATGSMVCFLDADDRLPPNSLASRVKVLLTRPEVHFVDGRMERFNEKGVLSIVTPDYTGLPFQELLSLSGKCFLGITWLIRRNPNRTYFFHEGLTHGEDLLFFLEIAEDGEYAYVQEIVYEYRVTGSSAMSNLKLLEKGYLQVEKTISSWQSVAPTEVRQFHKRWRSIMLKSYLKNSRIFDFLTLLVKA